MGWKIRAENIATQIEGVLTLDNRISVKAKKETLNNHEVAADIMDELFRSPYVDSDRIGVAVKNGQAALICPAASRFATHAAIQNAFEGGAKNGVNETHTG